MAGLKSRCIKLDIQTHADIKCLAPYTEQSLSASDACSGHFHQSHHAIDIAMQVAHERNSAELHTVCMEVAGDCLPNVVVSKTIEQNNCTCLLYVAWCVICMQAQVAAATAAFVLCIQKHHLHQHTCARLCAMFDKFQA